MTRTCGELLAELYAKMVKGQTSVEPEFCVSLYRDRAEMYWRSEHRERDDEM